MVPHRHLKPVSPTLFLHAPHLLGVDCRGDSCVCVEEEDATTSRGLFGSPCALLGIDSSVCAVVVSASAFSSSVVNGGCCCAETAAEMAAEVSASCTIVSL